ncbi:MAG TPA: hypothetical protein VKM54_21980 [Myxococcota bacterium]|nr:hypothetical protein [Myxococcota bacterium]
MVLPSLLFALCTGQDQPTSSRPSTSAPSSTAKPPPTPEQAAKDAREAHARELLAKVRGAGEAVDPQPKVRGSFQTLNPVTAGSPEDERIRFCANRAAEEIGYRHSTRSADSLRAECLAGLEK